MATTQTYQKANQQYANSQTVSIDSDEPVAKKFKRLYSADAKNGDSDRLAERGVKTLFYKHGFGGSGSARYEFEGHIFSVNRGANGKGFHGTQHSITFEGKVSA